MDVSFYKFKTQIFKIHSNKILQKIVILLKVTLNLVPLQLKAKLK